MSLLGHQQRYSGFGRTISNLILMDISNIRKELNLIISIIKKGSHIASNGIIHEIRSFIDKGLETSRSCISLDDWKRLVWYLEASPNASISQTIIHNLVFSWSQYLFRNSFTAFSKAYSMKESILNGFNFMPECMVTSSC